MSNRPTAWLIFDGDNTLWNVEELYDEARVSLAQFIGSRGYSRTDVVDIQHKIDADLFSTYGYSINRYPESFETTLKHFIPDPQAIDISLVRRFAEKVFERTANIFEDATDTLYLLKRHFRLGLITAGDEDVQSKRLRDAHEVTRLFERIEIVEKKTSHTYAQFCEKNLVPIDQSWSIGDSLRSDIIPARNLGLNAIWVENHNWSIIESLNYTKDKHVYVVKALQEIPEIVVAETGNVSHSDDVIASD